MKPVFCRIKDICAVPAISLLRKEMIYRMMPDGGMRLQRYQPGLAHALKIHIRSFPNHRYYIKTSK